MSPTIYSLRMAWKHCLTIPCRRIDGAYKTQPSDIAITYEEFMGRTAPLAIHGLNLEDLL